jgi:branched-chain amino acid transport system ATP-binding protein
VKGVSFEVQEGEAVTLIGSNGAGKSTILKTVMGLLKPRRGNVVFEDHVIPSLRPEKIVALGIGYVPEGRRVFPVLTVEENLEIGAYHRRDEPQIKADMERIFELFPVLKERRTQFAGSLSGGEQQMLVIGRALMSRPRLILMDEPSLGLAPLLVEHLFEVIVDLNRKQGTTLLLSEQNAFVALQVAHRGLVLETGNVALEGSAKELRDNENVQRTYMGICEEDGTSRTYEEVCFD